MTQFAMLGGKKKKNKTEKPILARNKNQSAGEKSKKEQLNLKRHSIPKERKKDTAQYEEAPLNVQFVWLCFLSLNEVYTNFSP